MKIITLTACKRDGKVTGYRAGVHKSDKALQGIAKTEVEALEILMDKIKERSDEWVLENKPS